MWYLIFKYLILPATVLIFYLASRIKDQKTSGIVATVLFHCELLFLLFILPGFKTETIFAGEGIPVALGYDIEGGSSGTLAADGSQSTNPPASSQVSGDNSLDQNVSTDDNSESDMTVSDKNKKKPTPPSKTNQNTNTTNTDKKNPEKKVDKSATYTKRKGAKNGNEGGDQNSDGQGGDKDGNRGNPNGKGDIPDTGDPGTGKDKSNAFLKGRPAKSLPQIPSDFEETGILKFEVVVRPDGSVKSARKIPPSTVTNYQQIERTRQLILSKLTFTAKPDAEEEQTGTITIKFERK